MPQQNETILSHPAYDSFLNTDLDNLLKKNNIKTLYVSGALTGVCVLNTMFSAFGLGYRVIAIKNCCSDKNKKRHQDIFNNYSNYLFITENI